MLRYLKNLTDRRDRGVDLDDQLYDPELQTAIDAMNVEDTPSNRKALYEVLSKTTYCLPRSGAADGEAPSVMATVTPEGAIALPAFSDPNALQRWVRKPHSMQVVTADKLFEMAAARGFAEIRINPAGPAGGTLTRDQYTSLAKGLLPE